MKKNKKDKKLEIIVEAAINEFAALPYDKVSVFKIAEKAGISRACFYCYFKNKEQIYDYILNEIKKEFYIMYLDNKKPSYFELIENLFEFFLSFKNSQRHKLVLMLLENLKPENINMFTSHDKLSYITEIVDYSNFKTIDKTTIRVLFKSNFACLGMLVLHYYKDCITKEKVEELFKNYINIIKFGAYKN